MKLTKAGIVLTKKEQRKVALQIMKDWGLKVKKKSATKNAKTKQKHKPR
jgi:hypothetical protein